MRVSRIHTDQMLTPGAAVELEGASAAYVARVLRLRPGAQLTIFNGRGGEYAGVLIAAGKDSVTCEIGKFDPVEREAAIDIALLQGIARGDRMDAIVQKSTELGVARLIPVATERSVVKLAAGNGDRKHAHWRGIVIAACEQSGRNRIPYIEAPMLPEQACQAVLQVPCRIVLDPQAGENLADVCSAAAIAAGQTIALLIGPEGGLTDEECGIAARAGFVRCRLGQRVLRTETASLAALSVVHAMLGDFRRSEEGGVPQP